MTKPGSPPRALAALALLAPFGLAVACTHAASDEPVAQQSVALTGGALPSDPEWVNGFSPLAVRLGTDGDGTPLYACRVMINGALTPGKTNATWGTCDVGWGGAEYWVAPFQTLVPSWAAGANGSIPGAAFALGRDGATPEYPCRVARGAALQVGRIRPGLGGCEYPYGGVSVLATTGYSVLDPNLPLAVVARDGGQPIPVGAVQAGIDDDGSALYACETTYAGHRVVGKTRASWDSCDVSWNGGEHWVAGPYQVVVLASVAAPLDVATTPVHAGSDSDGSPLGVCTVPYGGGASVHVGKYMAWGACNFGYGGSEVSLTSGYRVVAVPSHPPIWTEIEGGQPGVTNTLSCNFAPTSPLLPSNMPSQCTAGVVNGEPVWACPKSVEAQIPSRIGYGALAALPKCAVTNGVVTPPAGGGHCEVVYIATAPEAPSCFAGGTMDGWELVWDHEFIPIPPQQGPMAMQCEVMGCGGACPAQILPH